MRVLLLGLLLAGVADFAVVEPKPVAASLSKPGAPVILYVGPNVLYRGKHIAGAVYAGPGSTPAGLELLKTTVAKMPHNRDIVIYCGCCPWDHCPNIKPAMETLKTIGFANVKAIYLPENFKTGWIDRGYPVE
jgi:thiosulfate/3-mercaptopyruvate sulfurtransferase